MMYWYTGTWGWSMMIGMLLFWIVIIGLIIWGVSVLIKQSQQKNEKSVSPMDIVKMRYANGEISKKEFESMIKELKKQR